MDILGGRGVSFFCLPWINEPEGDVKDYGGEVVNVWSWLGFSQ